MSWKNRYFPEKESPSKMIEHSISKYNPPQNTQVIPFQQRPGYFGTKYWNKTECETYIEQLAKKGYVVGAQIKTKYGFLGTIESIREIPYQGLNFTEEKPNIFTIRKQHNGQSINNLLYGEHELTLLEEIPNAC